MIIVRRKDEIFYIDGGWFKGRWHFSFDQYRDPENTAFGTLRVFNIDTLVPGAVWPMHPHRDIEVITYCLEGEFEHADESGNGGVLYRGDVQHTSVGRGMYHSEINHRKDIPMTFLQIWIMPRERGLTPSMEQRKVKREERLNRFLTLVSSKDPQALPIQQDAEFLASALEPGATASHRLESGEGAYPYMVSGKIKVNEHSLSQGDAAKIVDEPTIEVRATEESELAMVVVRV